MCMVCATSIWPRFAVQGRVERHPRAIHPQGEDSAFFVFEWVLSDSKAQHTGFEISEGRLASLETTIARKVFFKTRTQPCNM